MAYYPRSSYYPLPSAPQAAAQPRQPQQQQQYSAPAPQVDQVYLRQQAQAQAQQLAYQQQQQQAQIQHQQIIEQHRQFAQQQYYQQQQQYAAQQQRLQQEQQYAQQQNYTQQQQQYQQQTTPSRQQQRSGYQPSPVTQQSPAPLYKSSEYVPAGGVYSTGGAYSQPSVRRVPSRADVNTAVENQEAPYQTFGQGINNGRVSQYNPYASYGQAVTQSPIHPQGSTQRQPSEYAYEGLNPVYKQQQYSQGNLEIGARSLNAPTTVVLDANNNAAPLPPRSPARGYSTPQRGYGSGSGAQAESAYISIPNNLVYAQSDQQRAYNYAQESRPVYASSSRTNQAGPSPIKLKPAAARELYAALSSENVRTALDRDLPGINQAPLITQTPAYSTYNGQRVQGRAFIVPADQKYSEYTLDDLNGLRSVIDR